MNTSMHGRAIASVQFVGGVGNEYGNPETVRADGRRTLHLSATYHGDHDEFWVVESLDGKEHRRFLARHCDVITWMPDSEVAKP